MRVLQGDSCAEQTQQTQQTQQGRAHRRAACVARGRRRLPRSAHAPHRPRPWSRRLPSHNLRERWTRPHEQCIRKKTRRSGVQWGRQAGRLTHACMQHDIRPQRPVPTAPPPTPHHAAPHHRTAQNTTPSMTNVEYKHDGARARGWTGGRGGSAPEDERRSTGWTPTALPVRRAGTRARGPPRPRTPHTTRGRRGADAPRTAAAVLWTQAGPSSQSRHVRVPTAQCPLGPAPHARRF